MRTTYHWLQIFPAKREVVVEHSYIPSVGGSPHTAVGTDYATREMMQDYTRRYCMHPPFPRAARKLVTRNAAAGNVVVSELRLGFVLETGANWAGPIGRFGRRSTRAIRRTW